MGQQGGVQSLLLPLVMFAAIFYFLIIRPQKKKQKAHDDMLASISKGDTVITAGGFFGIVRETLDDSYIIELDEGVKARILKSSISMKKSEGTAVSSQPKKKKSKKAIEAAADSGAQPQEDAKPAEEVKPAEEAPAAEPVAAENSVPEDKDAGSKKEEA